MPIKYKESLKILFLDGDLYKSFTSTVNVFLWSVTLPVSTLFSLIYKLKGIYYLRVLNITLKH